MMIIMKSNATPQQVESVIASVKSTGLNVHLSQGVGATIIGAIGETHNIPLERFESIDGVDIVQRITQPYKLASRQFHPESIIPVDGFNVGGGEIAVIAGPAGGKPLTNYRNRHRRQRSGRLRPARRGLQTAHIALRFSRTW